MELKKVVKAVAVALPMIVLAACSSTSDDMTTGDESRAGGTGASQTDGRRGVETGAADRRLTPQEERQERFAELRRDHVIYFDFDDASIRGEFAELLSAHGDYLVRNPNVSVIIEGHTDERGTPEYNIALGERRAKAVVDYLLNLGVSSSQMTTVSYGEEKPLVRQSNERAWSQNRRAVLVY
ncbi:MAG: peptidoglycan-associated lipoprotein Pal [Idiomarina sp.]|nr:peptidoglycan-associated lipoprotein Pal [Idiomarina sp.]